MQRELASLPLPPRVKQRLHISGFNFVQDVINLTTEDLSKVVHISREDCENLLELVKPQTSTFTPVSAHTLFQETKNKLQHVISFCQDIDVALCGGVPLARVTELCGPPGAGKTQLCLQLCIDTAIPGHLGGVDGESIFIDTEGAFVASRIYQMAEAVVEHCQTMEDNSEKVEHIQDAKSILSGVHYMRCLSSSQLLATVYRLPTFIEQHPKVKLVVIDSVAGPFRYEFEDFSHRTRLLTGLGQDLHRLANKHKLAVVVTNQMTTRIKGDKSNQVPALGESWSHVCSARLLIEKCGESRKLKVLKSQWCVENEAEFIVTTAGIRDVINADDAQEDEDSTQPSEQNTVDGEVNEPTAKRPRIS